MGNVAGVGYEAEILLMLVLGVNGQKRKVAARTNLRELNSGVMGMPGVQLWCLHTARQKGSNCHYLADLATAAFNTS